MVWHTSGKPTLDDVSEVVRLYLVENSPLWKKINGGIYREMESRLKMAIICHALHHHKGNIKASARDIGVSRTHLSRTCKSLSVNPSDFKGEYPWPYPKPIK